MQRSNHFYCRITLRLFSTIILSACSALSFGQEKGKFSLALQLQPELTWHKNYYYTVLDRKPTTKATFNVGGEMTVQYYFTERLFAETGLGYISRKLNTKTHLDQSSLPPPQGSPTAELVFTDYVAFRTLQFPLNVGYNIMAEQKSKLFLSAGLTGNYLMNTYYGLSGFKQYQGAYKKNYWQGYSVNLGFGADHQVSEKFSLTGKLSYSIINTMKDDEYLSGQNDDRIQLPHTYLRLSAGIRKRL